MLRNKLFLISVLMFSKASLFAANGTVLVIDKLGPKNDAFVGVVDSSQTLTNVTNFSGNLSASDTDVQKALDTLDNLAVGGGGGSTPINALNAQVLYSTGSTGAVGDNGFQYDSSVSSVSIRGKLGLITNSNYFYFDSQSADPYITLDDQNGSPGGGLNFQYGGINSARFRNTSSSWVLEVSTFSSLPAISRLVFPKNNQRTQIVDSNSVPIADFDPVGNSTFTRPIVLSSLVSASSLATDSTGKIIAGSGGGSSTTTASVGYGSIRTSNSSVIQTGIGTTPVKLTVFELNGQSANTTPSHTNDEILVSTTAQYSVFAAIYSTGTGVFTQKFWIAVNGSTQPISCPDTPSARCVMSDTLALVAGSTVSVYTSASVAGSTITVQDAVLVLHSVGGTGSGSGGGGSSYTTKIEKIPFSGGYCTYTDGCGTPTQYQSSVSSVNYVAAVFQDSTTSYWQARVPLPSDTGGPIYDGGTFTYQLVWTSTQTSGNVAVNAQSRFICDDGSIDQAFGTAIEIIDGSTANQDWQYSSYSAAMTAAGSYSAGCDLIVQMYREPFDSDDTLGAEARAIAFNLKYGLTP